MAAGDTRGVGGRRRQRKVSGWPTMACATHPGIEDELARLGLQGTGLLARLWNPQQDGVEWDTNQPHGSRLCGIIVSKSRDSWESADDQSLGRAARDLNVAGDVTRWKGATSGSAGIIGRC